MRPCGAPSSVGPLAFCALLPYSPPMPAPTDRALRHPEKRRKPETRGPARPDWIRVPAPAGAVFQETMEVVKQGKLHTVCEEAACPNIGQCWAQKHASFPPGGPRPWMPWSPCAWRWRWRGWGCATWW